VFGIAATTDPDQLGQFAPAAAAEQASKASLVSTSAAGELALPGARCQQRMQYPGAPLERAPMTSAILPRGKSRPQRREYPEVQNDASQEESSSHT
jgi:hypothetical protein